MIGVEDGRVTVWLFGVVMVHVKQAITHLINWTLTSYYYQMNSQTTWAVFSASLLSLLVALFSLFPRLLLFLAGWNQSSSMSQLSPLESFLARHLALYLAAHVVALIMNVSNLMAFY